MASAQPEASVGLLQLLLDEQQDLSVVERFAQRHASAEEPIQARYYRDKIPLSRPGPDQQYAFEVDLDRCSGCKACVTACHSLNGLDQGEVWRQTGRLIGERAGEAVQYTVTTACHHCEDPACLEGCPVNAYEKEVDTGIVRHLDDQCIGCRYCQLKCPYDVPRFDVSRGIVRKCDMCADRLAVGEAPACVQACPSEAIEIGFHERGSAPVELLPVAAGAMPDSDVTRPTTRYRRRTCGESLRPADEDAIAPSAAHDPLAVMLVLTQLSLGTVLGALLGGGWNPSDTTRHAALLAAIACASGMAASTLHLGRPLYAFRAVLGVRTSWLSREILAFGGFFGLLTAWTLWIWTEGLWAEELGGLRVPGGATVLGAATLATGAVAVFCSAMIYADTRRSAWRLPLTGTRFALTCLLLGAAVLVLLSDRGLAPVWAGLGLLATLAKLGFELRLASTTRGDPARIRGARLLRGALQGRWRLRLGLGAAGVAALAGAGLSAGSAGAGATVAAGLALLLLLAGELLERHLFFTAEASRGMPGW